MPFLSSVPKIQFTPAGLVIPSEGAVLSGVQADIDAAFGGGINPALETPQGQIASSETAVISDKNAEFAYLVNQFDPRYADGRFQDAIGYFYFMTRKPATPTTVQATLVGAIGTVIPAGTLAQDTSNNTYTLSGAVTIPSTGWVYGEFQNIVNGPIPCPIGTLTKVYQAVSGWDTITNDAAGALGQDVESRADFEYRRKNSVALNGRGTVQAIYANVFSLPDVVDVYVIDNPLGTIVLTGATDFPVSPHSVYVAVVGGSDVDIAKQIWLAKDTGCDYNGNTAQTVIDDSGYNYPYPSYLVRFERPDPLAIKFAVSIVNDTSLPFDIVSRVKAAIIARFNGADGTSRERTGSIILASRYYGAVVATASNVSLLSILIGTTSPTDPNVLVGIDQKPVLSENDITVDLV